MVDLTKALTALAQERPVFHSEADFQHALAWEIHRLAPECRMRLECKPPHLAGRIYLDIWCSYGDTILAIELKYKTRRLEVELDEETFDLLDQSAQDIGRYDFLKDVQRVEQIAAHRSDVLGYAILLTNDSAYWKHPINTRTVDASFRIHQGRQLTGEIRWGPGASRGTTRGREEPLVIRGTYDLGWKDYSRPSEGAYSIFRYLLVKVTL